MRTVIGSTPDQFGSLTIRGPVLAKDLSGNLTNICPFYPVPRDLVRTKDSRICLLLKPLMAESPLKNSTNFRHEGIYPCWPELKQHVEEIEGYLLSHNNLYQYLIGEFPQEKDEQILEKAENILQFESRLGIGLDPKTRTAKVNLLYSVNHIRLDDRVGLITDVDNHNDLLPEKALVRLGGDSRVVEYNKIEDERKTLIILIKPLCAFYLFSP